MRAVAIVVIATLALILQASVWRYLPFEVVGLDLWAVFALYLGLHAHADALRMRERGA